MLMVVLECMLVSAANKLVNGCTLKGRLSPKKKDLSVYDAPFVKLGL